MIGPLEKHSESAPAECAHLSPATYSLLPKLAAIMPLWPYRLICKLVSLPAIPMSLFILSVCLFGEGMCGRTDSNQIPLHPSHTAPLRRLCWTNTGSQLRWQTQSLLGAAAEQIRRLCDGRMFLHRLLPAAFYRVGGGKQERRTGPRKEAERKSCRQTDQKSGCDCILSPPGGTQGTGFAAAAAHRT